MKSSHFSTVVISLLILCLVVVGVIIIFKNKISFFVPPTPLPASQLAQTAGSGGELSCTVVCNGLVGYWPFSEGSGTTAYDASGNGNNGLLVNGPSWTTNATGDGALSFNGTSQYVAMSNDPSGTGAATFSAWIYPTAWGAQKNIIAAQQGALEFFVGTSYPTTTGLVSLSDNGGATKCGSPAASLALNTWYLVTATRDASGDCTIYINGAQVSTGSSGVPVAGTALSVASRAAGAGFYFSGSIDDVRIYNRVLAASEVSSLYTSTTTQTTSPPPATTYTLTLTNGGNGSVTSSPAGINCGSACTLSNLAAGAQITLTASPNTGYAVSWTGCTSSNGNSCTISMGSANALVSVTFTSSPSVPAPVISSINATAITANSATITWTTTTAASSQVFYGLTTTYGSQTALDPALMQSHSVTLTGLSPNTFYYYSVKSLDASGNSVLSASGAMFNTLSSPSSAPPSSGSGSSIHWVSPGGAASWSGCAGTSALTGTAACSMGTADQDATSGTVYITGGTYNNGQLLQPSNSGSSNNPINFTAYNGESVTFTSDFIPNGQMATSSWQSCSSPVCVSGASASLSSAEWWNGNTSTQFTTTAAGQGIWSGNFNLPLPYNSVGYDFYACVYSSSDSIHVSVIGGRGATDPLYNNDVALYPNLWTCFSTSYLPPSGQATSSAYVTFTSNATSSAGTWYIADVRMHSYGAEIELNNKSYINISGINVDDADQAFLLQDGSSYNQISNGNFTDVDLYSAGVITGPTGATQTPPSSYNWIHNNVFHDNGYVTWTGTSCYETGDTVRIGEDGDLDDYSMGNLVENNVIYHSSHDGILVATKYNTIRDNIFHNEDWFPDHYIINGLGCNTLANPAPDLGARNILFQAPVDSQDNYAGYNLVEGNRVGPAGTPYTEGANDIENATNGNIIRFNYLYAANSSGIEFKESSTAHANVSDPSFNHVYNNTFYDDGGGPSILLAHQGAIQINGVSSGFTPPVGNAVINNIMYDVTTPFSGTLSSSNFEGYGNIVNDNSTMSPLFIDPDISNPFSTTLPDLSLQAGSPDINAGTALTNVATSSGSGTGTTITVNDAKFFQDGSWCPPGLCQPDWIAVGTVGNVAQISSINYTDNTITLVTPLAYKPGYPVWLYKDSTGQQVLFGSAPDIGAYQYSQGQVVPNDMTESETSLSNQVNSQVVSLSSGGGSAESNASVGGGGGGAVSSVGGESSSISPETTAVSSSVSASASINPAFSGTLSPGSTGTGVKDLQIFLNSEGYTVAQTGPGSSGDETTYFGALTSGALRRFQSAHSLPSTGVLDATTEAVINSIAVSSAPSASTAGVVSAPAVSVPLFTYDLSLGMTGVEVKNLQVFLNSQGFTIATVGDGSTGHETTYFGALTRTALIRFQDSYASTILAPYGLSKGTGYFGSASIKEANSLIEGN